MVDGFIFYRVFAEALRALPAEEYKQCVIAICNYALDGEEPGEGLAKSFLELTKPYFNAELRKEMKEEARIWAEVAKKNDEQ